VPYRGRFAPSPTGSLHLGSAVTALFAAAAARRAGGAIVCRVEDLDPPRTIPGSEAEQLEDLTWLGLRFDEGPISGGPAGPYRQSERHGLYQAALDLLARGGHTYLCDCSRAEIARIASAPHEGEEGPRYPGTCAKLGMEPRAFKRPPAVRLRVPDGPVSLVDSVEGPVVADVAQAVGDFVLRRGDGVYAYQLAVVVDDLAMGITEVVRGEDLRSSAPRQALLTRLLGAEPPRYLHVPLLVGADGARLAKRSQSSTVSGQRALGRSPAAILGALASAYGQTLRGEGDPAADLAETFDPRRFPRGPVPVPAFLQTEAA
jgi:glutamyl-tRNA synthetase